MKITVIGAGSWGTALAIHFSLHGHPVSIWARNREQMAAMQNERENQRYLPGFPLPDNLTAHTELTEALEGSELVLMVTSVAGLRDSVELIKQAGYGHLPILTACKGFELDTGLLTFQVVRETLPDNDKIGVLSGPSFAQELAKQLPCAVVLASENEKWINGLVQELNTPIMRLYANTDIIGAAVGGAVKNVMAIATGLSDGLEYGMNARAALVTRGLAEMTRLAVALGAQQKTMMGLAGMGDLILTCTGALSRNRKVGLGLASGKPLHQVLTEIGHVAEGVPTIDEVFNTACRHQIDMPITQTLYELVRNELSAKDVAERLMRREAKSELPPVRLKAFQTAYTENRMTQPLEKLEARVYQLVQKFETLLGESRRHQLENVRLKAEQKRKDEQHQAAVDELSEALLVQVDKLKHDLQSKIDILTEENRHYRTLLEESAAEIRRLLARLPTKTPSETSPETEK